MVENSANNFHRPQKAKLGDLVIVTHPEYYTFGPDGFYGLVVDIDGNTSPRRITFMKSGGLWSFYEDDLGVIE